MKYVVRLWDGMDNQWMDVSKPISKDKAYQIWKEKTNNGTKNVRYEEIDYYDIFPANTRMLFSNGFGEFVR